MKLLHCYTANSKRIKCHQKIGLLALKSSKTLAWIVNNAMLKSEAVLNTFSVDQNARWDQETTSPLTNSWRSDGIMARIILFGPPRFVFHRCFTFIQISDASFFFCIVYKIPHTLESTGFKSDKFEDQSFLHLVRFMLRCNGPNVASIFFSKDK